MNEQPQSDVHQGDNLNRQSTDIPEEILEEAAIWQARLRDAPAGSSESRQIRADVSAWLLAHPLHQQAFAEMEAVWGALEEPVVQLMAEPTPEARNSADTLQTTSAPQSRGSHSQARSWIAMAACLVLTLLVGVGWQQDWATRWQSDYVTGVGEQTPMTLADGSEITLNSQSAVAVDLSPAERRVRLLKGEAWFDVASDPDRPFIVETGRGLVQVTGTRFNVRLEEEAAVVSLDEGSVQLRASDPAAAGAIELVPGQEARLTTEGITEPTAFDRSATTAWQRGQFVFYNAPLSQVVKRLNRYHAGLIVIADEELNNLKVSGVFSTSNPDNALKVITTTLAVEQTRLTDYLVLLR